MVRFGLVVVLAAGLAAGLAGTADSSDQTRQGRLLLGPVLAGNGAVWAETGAQDGAVQVSASAPDGKTVTLASFPADPSGCQFAQDLAASAKRVAFVRRIASLGGSGCYTARWEYYGGTPDAPLHLLEAGGEDGACGPPTLVELESDELLAIRTGCRGREVTVQDLNTGATVQTLPLPDIGEITEVDMAGRYIAYHGREVPREGARSAWIAVWDRESVKEIYRNDVWPLLEPRYAPVNYELRLRVDIDGTAVVRVPRYVEGALAHDSLFYLTPQEPRPHAIPVPPGKPVPAHYLTSFGLHDRRVALSQLSDAKGVAQAAVIDLAGNVVNVFDRPGGGAVDFDGRRLAWTGATIRNEAFPAAPPPAGGASLAAGAARLSSRDLVADKRGAVAAGVTCRLARGCSGRLLISSPDGATLAASRVSLRRRHKTLVSLSLKNSARRALLRDRALAVRVSLALPGRRASVASAMLRLQALR